MPACENDTMIKQSLGCVGMWEVCRGCLVVPRCSRCGEHFGACICANDLMMSLSWLSLFSFWLIISFVGCVKCQKVFFWRNNAILVLLSLGRLKVVWVVGYEIHWNKVKKVFFCPPGVLFLTSNQNVQSVILHHFIKL